MAATARNHSGGKLTGSAGQFSRAGQENRGGARNPDDCLAACGHARIQGVSVYITGTAGKVFPGLADIGTTQTWGAETVFPVRLAAHARLQGMLRYPELTRDCSTSVPGSQVQHGIAECA